MKAEKINKFLFNLEKRLNLYKDKIDGTYYWKRTRSLVHWELLKKLCLQKYEDSGVSLTEKIKSVPKILKNSIIRNPFFSSSKNILFYGHGRRELQDDGKWWDIYCDPIIEEIEEETIYLDSPNPFDHKTPRKVKNLCYPDYIIYTGAIVQKLGLVKVSLNRKEKQVIKKIENQIENELETKLDVTTLVKNHLEKRKALKPLYEKLLKFLNPKIAVVVSGSQKRIFIEACDQEDIPTIELQHGVSHKQYNPRFYPFDSDRPDFPDYYFTFGDYWKENWDFPIEDDHVYSVGYPYLEQKKKEYEDVKSKNQIVFISDDLSGENLSKFAAELSSQDIDYEIVYKLKPGGEKRNWRDWYPWLTDADLKVVADYPLYKLFAESKIQIGAVSTALFEGLNFDLSTYILDLPHIEIVQPLIDGDAAKVIETVDEFVNELKGNPDKSEIDTGYFFKKNSLENMKNALNEVRDREKISGRS